MTPGELDVRLRERGVSLPILRAAIDPVCFEPSPRRAWIGLVRVLATLALGEALLCSVPRDGSILLRVAGTFAGWLLATMGMVGLFVIGHDCGHQAFSRRRWVNSLVGHLCMSPILTGFHSWRVAHDHHHAHTQLRGEDPDWPERMPTRAEWEGSPWFARLQARLAYGSVVGILAGFAVGAFRRIFLGRLYPQVKIRPRVRRLVLVSNAIMITVTGGCCAALFHALGPWALVKLYLVPLYGGMVLGALFTFLHHSSAGSLVHERSEWTPLRGQIVGTFDVRFPRWFEWLSLHINRHLPHHLAPRIPWYHLPRATRLLEEAVPDLRQDRRFGLRYLRSAWSAPVLQSIAPGMYETRPLPATR